MHLVLEPRRDAEVAAAAADGPEQVGMLLVARPHDVAGSGHDLRRTQAVDRHPVLAHQPAEPAAERQPGDAGGGYHAARAGEPVELRLAVVVAPRRPALSDRPARPAIDAARRAWPTGRPPARRRTPRSRRRCARRHGRRSPARARARSAPRPARPPYPGSARRAQGVGRSARCGPAGPPRTPCHPA